MIRNLVTNYMKIIYKETRKCGNFTMNLISIIVQSVTVKRCKYTLRWTVIEMLYKYPKSKEYI